MATPLPRLRNDLDFMPSPVPDRPGLLIRDCFGYSDTTLIIPPPLVACLSIFDGQHQEDDLREVLYRLTGELNTSGFIHQLVNTLSRAGFLENEVYESLRAASHERFQNSAVREAAHSGSAYPAEREELNQVMAEYLAEAGDGQPANVPQSSLVGIAAPHVSPEGGWQSYRSAFQALRPEHRERTFVVLGTSHYGAPEKFGLTRKPFITPFGQTQPECGVVDRLREAAPGAVLMEDYCHSVEHSIEFQVVFLQYLFGPDIRVIPILCGPFAQSIYRGGRPEQDEQVLRFFAALGELAVKEGGRLMWVLGIDMAHIGKRYGDEQPALENQGHMLEVAARDRQRIGSLEAADAPGFWSQVQENRDDLKWCGSSPLYTFLKCVPFTRGHLRHYQQWNIDSQSVVTFGALSFHD
jgi:MEMO1 family protein